MPTRALRRVTRLAANAFVARWRLPDRSVIEHALTEQEYRVLAQKGAGAPPNRTGDPRAVWLHAREQWTFDTLSGVMESWDVTNAWPGVVKILLPGLRRITVPLEKTVGILETLSVDAAALPVGVTIINGVATVV